MSEGDLIFGLCLFIMGLCFVILVILINETGSINAKITEMMRMSGCIEFEHYDDYRCPINGTLTVNGDYEK